MSDELIERMKMQARIAELEDEVKQGVQLWRVKDNKVKELQARIAELEGGRASLIRVIYGFWENRRDNAGFITHLEDNGVIKNE